MTAKKKHAHAKGTMESIAGDRPQNATGIEEQIRVRAYELYEQRGCVFGYDLDDWLQAEVEILGKASRSEAA